ncbi:RES domain-containing protein [Noviherbaspirillum humi]|uniref:RES domain-containing protein n=1 Tax=Noviherbaspirillum humi TaxID=1688639 RepID=UPI001160629B|nr:RES domain-containing protein [Noviherbaspirillum humi]
MTDVASSQDDGRQWLTSPKQLVLLVPSAVIREAANAVINTLHPACSTIRVEAKRSFSSDHGLFS